jgi:hypothetical protein
MSMSSTQVQHHVLFTMKTDKLHRPLYNAASNFFSTQSHHSYVRSLNYHPVKLDYMLRVNVIQHFNQS